jgi:hypothetical protein
VPIAIEFTAVAAFTTGALGGIHSPPADAHGRATERLHYFLRPSKN